MVENKSYQKIKVPDSLCNNCAFYDNFSRNCKLSYYINHYPAYSCLKDEIFVEIKQNKEDMKEKKLNLRPFDLEAAKAGKPVYTRDGRKVRIICFDAKCIKPIVALIQGSDNSEQIEYYTENGVFSNGGTGKNRDLMILLEKKEGWVNIYGEEKGRYCSNVIYSSKEEALNISKQSLNISKQSEEHITTTKRTGDIIRDAVCPVWKFQLYSGKNPACNMVGTGDSGRIRFPETEYRQSHI